MSESANTEAIPIVLAYNGDEDRRNHILTFLREENGRLVVHRRVEEAKIIDGTDLIIKKEVQNGQVS